VTHPLFSNPSPAVMALLERRFRLGRDLCSLLNLDDAIKAHAVRINAAILEIDGCLIAAGYDIDRMGRETSLGLH